MNARDMRDEMRRAVPGIDNQIRAARNGAVSWSRAAARAFESARTVLDDFREGYMMRGTTAAGADQLAVEYVDMAFRALEWAASSRREMHRLIRFRRTAIPD